MTTLNLDKLNFQKQDGLIPAVVQDIDSGTVLMVGFQNYEAVTRTLQTQKIVFWSRTKNRLWTKGEESGNFLLLETAAVDCDQDTILYGVKAPKATCHTGSFSCFGATQNFGFVAQLFQTILDRKQQLPEDSYTTSLFREGLDRIAQKVGEEAVETVIAAKNDDRTDFVNESSDLLFHWLVLCAEKGISLSEIITRLEQRGKK